MKLSKPAADTYIPDAKPFAEAVGRTTHLAIGAHQDDLEFMAYEGIVQCFGRSDKWFSGVVVTDGAGSSRSGIYAAYTDAQIAGVRPHEQRKAAYIGEFAAMFQLGFPSKEVKDAKNTAVVDDLLAILTATKPEVVYLHNPADKHDTHIAVTLRAIAAMRRLPKADRPKKVIGCEVWRDLDWLVDTDKVVMDVSGHQNLAASLNGVFDSQITGGKRYDLAVMGRRVANATFFDSHASDAATHLQWGMDLTALIQDDTLDVIEYTLAYVDRLKGDIKSRIAKFA